MLCELTASDNQIALSLHVSEIHFSMSMIKCCLRHPKFDMKGLGYLRRAEYESMTWFIKSSSSLFRYHP